MKKLTSEIEIGNYKLDFIENIEVVSSWENFIGTAKLTVPKRAAWDGKPIYGGNSIFKPNDYVLVKIGYNYANNVVFEGTIKNVQVKAPITLDCVNEMEALKFINIERYSARKVTLWGLLQEFSPFELVTQDVNLGQYRISNATLLEVLEDIKKKYSLQAFIKNGKLYVGTPYLLLSSSAVKHTFDLNGGIVSDDDLIYQRSDEVKVKVKAVSIQKDNSRKEIEIGDKDGELRTLNYYNKSENELKEAAKADLERLKYEGYRGSFLAFGEPFVQFGDKIQIKDSRYPEREGVYFVKSVTYTFGIGGYRQKIELERKV